MSGERPGAGHTFSGTGKKRIKEKVWVFSAEGKSSRKPRGVYKKRVYDAIKGFLAQKEENRTKPLSLLAPTPFQGAKRYFPRDRHRIRHAGH